MDELTLWNEYKKSGNSKPLQEHFMQDLLHITYSYCKGKRLVAKDLLGDAALGLNRALCEYKVDCGASLRTFVCQHIRWGIADGIRYFDMIGRHRRLDGVKFHGKRAQLEQKVGRSLNLQEYAELSKTNPSVVQKQANNLLLGYTASLSDSSGSSLGELKWDGLHKVLVAKNDPVESNALRLDVLRLVTMGMGKRERLVVILYYYYNMTMKAVAESIGVTDSYVSLMHKDILQRWKERFKGSNYEFDFSTKPFRPHYCGLGAE